MRPPSRLAATTAATVAIALAGAAPARAGRPNILFIYTDDQARWGVAAYGNAEVRTPNLDRLAGEGALFLNAFAVTPVCSPSRATFFTGRYPTELGIEDWIDPAKEPEVGLSPDTPTWPKLLQQAGYRTGLVGKWHLGTATRFHPTRNGFLRFTGSLAGRIPPRDPELEVEGEARRFQGAASDILADEAIRFLRTTSARPFLLGLCFRAPHSPYAPVPEEDAKPYETLDPALPAIEGLPAAKAKKLRREYYASNTCLDRNVGRVLAELDALGLRDSTLVLFTSDHGYMIGEHGLHHKGNAAWLVEGKTGHRPNFFDDAIRVPFIVRWPGVVRPGMRIERLVSSLDVFPTMLEIAGVPPPPGYADRGRSFAGALRGDTAAADTGASVAPETLLGQYDMHHYQRDRMRMLRTPRWKLVRHHESSQADELYDLAADPGELSNLAGSPQARDTLIRLLAELDARLRAIGDPLAGK